MLFAIGCSERSPQPPANTPADNPTPLAPEKQTTGSSSSGATDHPDEPVLSPKVTAVPGILPTGILRYRAAATVTHVAVAGSWDRWKVEHPLTQTKGVWEIDLGALKPSPGRHEFKFIVDDEYESGQNRLAFVNGDHLLERPPGILAGLWIDTPNSIRIDLARPVPPDAKITVTLDPEQAVRRPRLVSPKRSPRLEGFALKGERVRFIFDPAYYGETLPAEARVSVAGPFNDWKPDRLVLAAQAGGTWEAEVPFADVKPVQENEPVLFKFVIEGERWMAPPVSAPNRTGHGGAGHTNLSINWQAPSGQYIVVDTAGDLPVNQSVLVRIRGYPSGRWFATRHRVAYCGRWGRKRRWEDG